MGLTLHSPQKKKIKIDDLVLEYIISGNGSPTIVLSGVAEVSFEDTEHFSVTRDFLNNYPRRLEQLLEDDDASA